MARRKSRRTFGKVLRLPSGRYVDGAVHSPSNADLVAGLAFDLVVVASPMTAPPGALAPDGSWGARARRWFGTVLDRELATVIDQGTPVLRLEPTSAELGFFRGDDPEEVRAADLAASAHRSVLAQLRDPANAAVVDLLGPSA